MNRIVGVKIGKSGEYDVMLIDTSKRKGSPIKQDPSLVKQDIIKFIKKHEGADFTFMVVDESNVRKVSTMEKLLGSKLGIVDSETILEVNSNGGFVII